MRERFNKTIEALLTRIDASTKEDHHTTDPDDALRLSQAVLNLEMAWAKNQEAEEQ